MKANIAIIGFMGSGKSTVGEVLAERIGYNFFDLDKIIELTEGRTVNEIFLQNKEEYFRDIESKIIRKIIKNKNCVFACGIRCHVSPQRRNVRKIRTDQHSLFALAEAMVMLPM